MKGKTMKINEDKIIKFCALLNARVLKNDKNKEWDNVRLISNAMYDLLKILQIDPSSADFQINKLSKWSQIYDKELEKNNSFCPKEFELDFLNIVD